MKDKIIEIDKELSRLSNDSQYLDEMTAINDMHATITELLCQLREYELIVIKNKFAKNP